METKTIQEMFDAARAAGLCYNRLQFAQLLGVDKSVISNALNKGASVNLLLKAEKILQEHGVFINGESVTTRDNINNETPQENNIAPLVAEMAAQREMYDKHLSEALRIISKLTEKNG